MLTLDQLEKIASILNWTAREVEASLEYLNNQFMTPDVQDLMAGDCEGFIEEDGVYARLSASGYLDCTDWFGPFETIDEAVAYLLSTFADDVEISE